MVALKWSNPLAALLQAAARLVQGQRQVVVASAESSEGIKVKRKAELALFLVVLNVPVCELPSCALRVPVRLSRLLPAIGQFDQRLLHSARITSQTKTDRSRTAYSEYPLALSAKLRCVQLWMLVDVRSHSKQALAQHISTAVQIESATSASQRRSILTRSLNFQLPNIAWTAQPGFLAVQLTTPATYLDVK